MSSLWRALKKDNFNHIIFGVYVEKLYGFNSRLESWVLTQRERGPACNTPHHPKIVTGRNKRRRCHPFALQLE